MSEEAVTPKESTRAWFERKTKKVRKAILWSGLFAVVGSPIVFFFMPDKHIATLQVFNGAITIPVFAGLWMVSFVFLFLLPTREASFRSQEGIDESKDMLRTAIDEKVGPAMKSLENVCARVNSYLDGGVVEKFEKAVEEARKATHERIVPAADCMNRVCQRIEGAIVNSKLLDEVREAASAMGALCRKYEKAGAPDPGQVTKFMDESKPVLAMLVKLQKKFEKDFNDDFFVDLRDAVKSVRELGGMPMKAPAPRVNAVPPAPIKSVPAQAPVPVPVPVREVRVASKADPREPDMARALEVIRRKKVEAKV
jgi:hypothetical protein